MPNWCSNDLYLDGPADKLNECLTFIGEVFDFDKLIPYPSKWKEMDIALNAARAVDDPVERAAAQEEYRIKYGTLSDGYNAGGYEWAVEHWGTKWNLLEVTSYEHPMRGRCLTFDSAWSPPLPVIEALATKFPELYVTLEYFEAGGAFCGGVLYRPTAEAEADECDRFRSWQGDYAGDRGG
jgi:hypothetical protein